MSRVAAVAAVDEWKDARAAPGIVGVRITRPDEIDLILPLAREYHRESRYNHIPFSETKLRQLFTQGFNNQHDTFGAYMRHGERVVGIVHAGVGDYYLGDGGRIVTVLSFYVPKDIRDTMIGGRVTIKMMRILTDWAKAQRAEEIHIHTTSGISPRRTDRMLRRLGFRTLGGYYSMAVGQ